MPKSVSNTTLAPVKKARIVIYRHTARPQWGRAVLAWDTGDKRGYQFEDGSLRIIKSGYYRFFEEEVLAEDEAATLIAALRLRLGWKEQPEKKSARSRDAAVQLQHQIQLFGLLFPKGFQGARWAREKRGIDVNRQLKRHREQAILETKRLFAKERLAGLIQAEKHSLIVDSMREVCDVTDLVTKAQALPLTQVGELDEAELATSLYNLLHDEEQEAICFERFVSTLARVSGKTPSWQLSTVFLALFRPKEHICIRPSTMRNQGARMSSTCRVPQFPSAPDYKRLLALAEKVRDHHQEADNGPRDLLDVYDFMQVTLTPKALEQMRSMTIPGRRPTRSGDDQAAA